MAAKKSAATAKAATPRSLAAEAQRVTRAVQSAVSVGEIISVSVEKKVSVGEIISVGVVNLVRNTLMTALARAQDVGAELGNLDDILYWIGHEPKFGKQAVFLDDANVPAELPSLADLKALAARGVKIVAPPMWALLTVDANGAIAPSQYARNAKAANLDIITWTLERSGRIVQEVLPTKGTASPEFYYQTTLDALHNDGDILTTLDVLAKQVGIRGIFSDWAATVSYYANCMGLK